MDTPTLLSPPLPQSVNQGKAFCGPTTPPSSSFPPSLSSPIPLLTLLPLTSFCFQLHPKEIRASSFPQFLEDSCKKQKESLQQALGRREGSRLQCLVLAAHPVIIRVSRVHRDPGACACPARTPQPQPAPPQAPTSSMGGDIFWALASVQPSSPDRAEAKRNHQAFKHNPSWYRG